jgi:hypothetical protein
MNFKLGVKVAHSLPLSWLVLRTDCWWPSQLVLGSKMVYPKVKIFKSKELYRVVPQIKGLDEHFPDQLKFWRYDIIWWRNDVKSVPTISKTHLFTPWVHVCPNAGMWVNACPNGKPESMYSRMWGGLLQDTVSAMGDMVHFVFCFCM